ncbi:hypothetical protein HHSLTHF2_29060 [Vreelandella venusta]|jgi:uncharacterized membrane protein YhiD involved in acid resistance|uniref:Zinc resistance-associated protein n=1 Tax=Halomonas hydrothermalis TaxID=115561 RepID=A0A6F8U7B6_9GAMM|nr:hypothetical protein HHSLTHF2_29060 [Halomonas hydrothermalis]
MNMSLHQLFAPALLAVALMPLAFSANASHHSNAAIDREAMQERMEEYRQEAYQRAGLSEEQQTALNEAHTEHRDAMLSLREEHQSQVAEILTEEEQQALRDAMREMHAEKHGERRQGEGAHGKRDHERRGHHSEPAEESAAE